MPWRACEMRDARCEMRDARCEMRVVDPTAISSDSLNLTNECSRTRASASPASIASFPLGCASAIRDQTHGWKETIALSLPIPAGESGLEVLSIDSRASRPSLLELLPPTRLGSQFLTGRAPARSRARSDVKLASQGERCEHHLRGRSPIYVMLCR